MVKIINEALRNIRLKTKLSKEEFSERIEMPWRTWYSYELGHRIPRPGVMKKLMKILDIKSPEIFYPELIAKDEKKNTTHMICEYMNSMSEKKFNPYDVAAIRKAVRSEYLQRKSNGIEINANTNEGKKIVNEAIACIANSILKAKKITVPDVELFKRCKLYESEDRNGESVWGLPEAREYYGFDGETGKEK